MGAGKDWLMDSEVGNASPETGVACLAMLAVDSLLGVIAALESLTDTALAEQEGGGAVSGSSEPLRVATETSCVAMVAATWHLVLPALSLLLGRTNGEVLVLKLLRVRPIVLQQGKPAREPSSGCKGICQARASVIS